MNNLFDKFKDKDDLEINKAFVESCKQGNLDEVKYLLSSKELEKNADITYKGNSGFLFACVLGNLNVIEYLLSSEYWRQDFETYYENAVKFACSKGHFEVVKFLLTSDIVDRKEHIIINPGFYSACESGEIKIVEFLFDNYKNRLDSFGNCNSFTLGHYFSSSLDKACENGHLEVVSYLLNSVKTDNNHVGYHLKSYVEELFPIACKNGHLHIVDYFFNSPYITKHVDFKVTQHHFQLACSTGLVEMAKYFLESPISNKNIDIHANYDCIFINALDANDNDLIHYFIFDINIKKTPFISSYLEFRSENEQVKNWFNLRDLNKDLSQNLLLNNENKKIKTKI